MFYLPCSHLETYKKQSNLLMGPSPPLPPSSYFHFKPESVFACLRFTVTETAFSLKPKCCFQVDLVKILL